MIRFRTLLALAVSVASTAAGAATFSPGFDTPAFSGSQYDVTATENAYYATNYGITVSNVYLYLDSRDTFDGVGIANGPVAQIGTAGEVGRVDFLDTTEYVTIDYLALHAGVYSAFDAVGTLLSSFSVDGTGLSEGLTGTETLSGGIISYITFTGDGGYLTISGLVYNYDGTTDGVNQDLDPVPLPTGGLLLLSGMAALGLKRRRGVKVG